MGARDPHSHGSEAAKHRAELGRYLRARREQIRPEDFGIARGQRRRVPGLRRAEVAELASVSPTWYTWLEQGRDIQASAEVLDAICRVLQLDEHASRYVRRLAGKPMQEPSVGEHALDPAVVCLIADLSPAPACAVTEAYDIVSWNTALAKVVGDPATIPRGERNLVRMCFDNPSFRDRVTSWSAVAKSAIAELRDVAALHPHSDRLRQLIDQMKTSNSDFRQAWNALNVRPFFGEVATIDVGGAGAVHFKVLELVLRDESPTTVVVFQPVDTQSRNLLAELLSAPANSSDHCAVPQAAQRPM